MKTIPKYVDKLLYRRYKLAMDLIDVCCEVDTYIEKIGGDLSDPEIGDATNTGCMIYCEPAVAERVVRDYIKSKLNEEEINELD